MFTVPIRIDAAGTDTAIGRVTAELDRAERAGKAAGEVVSRMLGSGKLRADQATAALRMYTQEFIAAERAAERAAVAVAKIQPPKGLFDGVLSGAGLAGLAGGTAGIAAIATQKVMELGREVVNLGEAYGNLDNRLRSIAPLEEKRLDLMDQTRAVANASRADWNATNELFVRLTSSTKEMGLSQERVLGITETISKTFAKSGASSAEAAAGMLQLSQAFASGKLQGDEFKSLSESVPDVLDLIAKQMGVSRGELKALSSEGKITGDVLVATFENAKNQIDQGFGKTTPTLSQGLTVLKNDMQATFGPLLQDFLPKVVAKLQETANHVAFIVDKMAKVGGGVSAAANADVGGVSGRGLFDVANGAFNPIEQANALERLNGTSKQDIENKKESIRLYVETLKTGKDWINVLIDESQQVVKNGTEWGQYKTQLEAFLASTKEIANPTIPTAIEGWSKHVLELTTVLDGASDSVDALTSKLLGADFVQGRKLVGAMFGQGAVDTLQQLSVAGEQAEGGWASTRSDPLELGRKRGGGTRRAARQSDSGYWNALADDLKNAAAALQLFDFWADNSAEHFKFLLDLSEQARDKSISGGTLAAIGGDANAQAARDRNFLKPANDLTKQRVEQINAEEVAMIRMQERAKETAEIMKTAFGSVENALVKLATTGEFSFKGMMSAMMADLARLAANKLIMSLIGALTPEASFASGIKGGVLRQTFQGEYGSGYAHGGVFHAAHGLRIGGSSTVGDKVPFFAMVNSGEDVTIRNRFQQGADGGAESGRGRDRVVMVEDRRALTATQREEEIVKVLIKHRERLR